MNCYIQVKKLDRRYDGHDLFTHRAEFHSRGTGDRRPQIAKFIELRNHLWARFGPSVEHDLFFMLRDSDGGPAALKDVKWAWSGDSLNMYLRDEALTEFLLMKERYENI